MDIEKIRNFFRNDRHLTLTGVQIDEVAEDYALCSLEIEDRHLNASNIVQGGVSYTLADSAFGVACNTTAIDTDAKKLSVTQSTNMSYFKPPQGKLLIAEAKKLSGGKRISVYSVALRDELGTQVALMIGTAYAVEL